MFTFNENLSVQQAPVIFALIQTHNTYTEPFSSIGLIRDTKKCLLINEPESSKIAMRYSKFKPGAKIAQSLFYVRSLCRLLDSVRVIYNSMF